MSYRRYLALAAQVMVVVILVALVAGQVLGQPILFSFVTTGSMAPTLDAGDGFVAIPTELSGEVGEGDVVVFQAQEIEGGDLTTHRIVGETETGYVTRGDANPFTDQDAGEPPVQDAQIVATAWEIRGSVVTIPHMGTAVLAIQGAIESTQRWLAITFGTRAFLDVQGLALMLAGLALLAYLVDVAVTRKAPREKDRARPRQRESGTSGRLVLVLLAVMVVLAATAAMTIPAGTQEFGIVSAEFESERPTVIPQGTAEDLPYLVPNSGFVPIYAFVEPASPGAAVDPRVVRVDARSEAEVTLTLEAPEETGFYQRYVTEHRYVAILPGSVITELHAFHPWAPIVVINALLGGGVYAFGIALLGLGPSRFRERDRSTSPSWSYRLKSRLF